MEYTSIGRTEATAFRVGIGTWALGGRLWGRTDEELSIRTILATLERGVTLIDTAPTG